MPWTTGIQPVTQFPANNTYGAGYGVLSPNLAAANNWNTRNAGSYNNTQQYSFLPSQTVQQLPNPLNNVSNNLSLAAAQTQVRSFPKKFVPSRVLNPATDLAKADLTKKGPIKQLAGKAFGKGNAILATVWGAGALFTNKNFAQSIKNNSLVGTFFWGAISSFLNGKLAKNLAPLGKVDGKNLGVNDLTFWGGLAAIFGIRAAKAAKDGSKFGLIFNGAAAALTGKFASTGAFKLMKKFQAIPGPMPPPSPAPAPSN